MPFWVLAQRYSFDAAGQHNEDNGRPSIDPVVLVKIVLIQHLYGLPSLLRTADEIYLNTAYR